MSAVMRKSTARYLQKRTALNLPPEGAAVSKLKMKKGQGLPLNMIVLAAIAVLILVLVVAFSTGSWGKLFRGIQTIQQGATPEEITGFRIGCEQSCFQVQQLVDTENEFLNSEYCRRSVKTNETGSLQDTRCWQPPSNVECSKTISTPSGTSLNCRGTGAICDCI